MKPLDIYTVFDAIAAETGISREEIAGRSRLDRVTEARHLAAWAMRTCFPATHEEIGTTLGNRDHSTITHALTVIKQRFKVNPQLKAMADRIKREVERAVADGREANEMNNPKARLVGASSLCASADCPRDSSFAAALRALAETIHATAVAKGWWDPDKPREDGTLVALMHSELSEALEGLRRDAVSDKIPPFQSVEEELADCVVRILDAAAGRGWDVAGALEAKLEYNNGRSYRHGGKEF